MSDKQLKDRMTFLFNKLLGTKDKNELKKIFGEAINLGMEYQHYKDIEVIEENFFKNMRK